MTNREMASESFLMAEIWEASRIEWIDMGRTYLRLGTKARAMRAFGTARQRAKWRDLSLSRAARWIQS
jgi:hypothetical protein